MFTKTEDDDFAIVRAKGVTYQRRLYTYRERLYFQHGSGFCRIRSDGSTTHPDLTVEELIYGGNLYADSLQRLYLKAGSGRKKVEAPGLNPGVDDA